MQYRQTQACLVISPLRSEDIQTLQQERVPFVTLHQYEDCEATSVAVDFAEVARIGMRHLISLGHRRIGVIGGPLPRPDQNVVRGSDIFVRACRQIMAECGLTVRNELIEQSNYLEQDAARITERWLSMPDRPTAIFAVDDLLAKGAYNTIRGHALRIPADVAGDIYARAPHLASGIQPKQCHAFSIPWRIEQAVDHFFISVGGLIRQKIVDLF